MAATKSKRRSQLIFTIILFLFSLLILLLNSPVLSSKYSFTSITPSFLTPQLRLAENVSDPSVLVRNSTLVGLDRVENGLNLDSLPGRSFVNGSDIVEDLGLNETGSDLGLDIHSGHPSGNGSGKVWHLEVNDSGSDLSVLVPNSTSIGIDGVKNGLSLDGVPVRPFVNGSDDVETSRLDESGSNLGLDRLPGHPIENGSDNVKNGTNLGSDSHSGYQSGNGLDDVETLGLNETGSNSGLDNYSGRPSGNGSGKVRPLRVNDKGSGLGLVGVVAAKMITPPSPRKQRKEVSGVDVSKKRKSCDIFDGRWVLDNDSNPYYPPGSCPFLDYAFNCFNNGRPDLGYLQYRWQPHGCDIPRFDGKKMLEKLRGKRMVFIGDSLNRNMWQSLVCSLRMSLVDKHRMSQVLEKRQFRKEGSTSFKFKDYNCSIEYIRSPFLVQQWKSRRLSGVAVQSETLRLDMIQDATSEYHNADFLIFNTGHWWTYHKTQNGLNFFQEGDVVHGKLRVPDAYTKAINTWAKWIDNNVNKKKTTVFFAGYSASHFRGGKWNSGGSCNGETVPITNDSFLGPYPRIMTTLESVISKMRTPVVYLNITKLTGYRKDAHPSIYRQPGTQRQPGMPQDCSHWCLPGVPDTWNQLLYASLLHSSKESSRTH